MSVAEPSQNQGPEPVGIAYGIYLLAVHHEQRIGTAHLLESEDQGVQEVIDSRFSHEVHHHLGVNRRLEDMSLFLQVVTQGPGIGEVAVMGQDNGSQDRF